MNRVKSFCLASFILLLVMAVAGCESPQVQMSPMPVQVQIIQHQPIVDSSEYMASLISRQSVILKPQVFGQVSSILVQPGQAVSKGSVLLVIDPSRQQATVASASAAAESQRAQINQAREHLKTLQEQREALLSTVELTQSQYNRYSTLYSQQSASQQEMERYRNELNQAKSNLQANQAQISAQQAAIATAQKLYEQARAGVREQSVELQYYQVRAPFSGIVGHIPVKLGSYVDPQTALLSVTDNRVLEVNVNVPAEQSDALHVGLPLQILNEAGHVVAQSQLSFVSPRVDELSQTILSKALLVNVLGRLKADQIANVRLIWRTFPGIIIPMTSVMHLGGRDFVFVAERAKPKAKDYVARQRPVMLGHLQYQGYVVKEGLQPGERLILTGVQRLIDGTPVTPMSNPVNQ